MEKIFTKNDRPVILATWLSLNYVMVRWPKEKLGINKFFLDKMPKKLNWQL